MEPETTTTRPPEEGEATQKILRMISDDAVAEGLQTSELVQKVRESITEISANRYVRALVGEEARARPPSARPFCLVVGGAATCGRSGEKRTRDRESERASERAGCARAPPLSSPRGHTLRDRKEGASGSSRAAATPRGRL